MMSYREQMKQDIRKVLQEEFTTEEIEKIRPNDKTWNKIFDMLWIEDRVTGNGSGSYFFHRQKAKEMIGNNLDELAQVLKDEPYLIEEMIKEDWETVDVCIRCTLLSRVLYTVINEW